MNGEIEAEGEEIENEEKVHVNVDNMNCKGILYVYFKSIQWRINSA